MFEYVKKYKFEIALFFLIAGGLFLNPYYFAISDHTYKIPFLKAEYHPGLYPRDLTVSMRCYYVSYFGVLLGPLVKIFNLELAFFIVFYITQILFYLSVYLLATAIFKKKLIGLMSVVWLWFPQKILGGIATFDSIVEERTLAAALLLLAIYLLITKKRFWAGGLMALAANIHFITFVNLGLFGAIAFWVQFLAERDKLRLLKESLPFCLLLFVGILPIILKSALGAHAPDPFGVVDPAWLRMILARSAWHFSVSSPELVFFISQAVAGLFLLFLFQRTQAWNDRPGLILYAASIITLVLGLMLGYVVVARYPILIGLQLLFFRSSYMFVILSAMVWAYLFYETFRRCGKSYRWAGVLIFGLFVVGVPAVRHYPDSHIDNPFKRSINENMDAQLWLKQHTDPGALILTPPASNADFRIFSERSIFGTWKDWTYNDVSREFAFSMYERLRDVAGVSMTQLERNGLSSQRRYYANLSEDKLIRMSAQYKIGYIVMEDKRARGLEKVYENRKYVIYKPILRSPARLV